MAERDWTEFARLMQERQLVEQRADNEPAATSGFAKRVESEKPVPPKRSRRSDGAWLH
jgi:hypothetical protein